MEGLIYMYTSPSDKKYVGQTIRLKKRIEQHIQSAYDEKSAAYNCAFHKAIRKYGIENFKFEILEENIPREKLDEREEYWIEKMESFGDKGYNLTKGGNGNKGRIWSAEQREAQSKRIKGRHTGPCSEETKKKISLANKGKGLGTHRSEEVKRKISEHNARAVVKKITFANSGIYHDKEFYPGLCFESVTEAAQYFNVALNTLSSIKHGKYNKNINMLIVEIDANS